MNSSLTLASHESGLPETPRINAPLRLSAVIAAFISTVSPLFEMAITRSPGNLARAAVDAFGAMQKVGRRAGARKQRRHISSDIFRFAYAGDVDAPAARLDSRDQVGGSLEIVFVADLRAELAEFFNRDVEEDRNGLPVGRG